MHVLLINQVFHPDVAATAQHAHDLGRHLAAHGHRVTAIASRSIYGQKGATLPRRDSVDGIEIRRVGRSFFGKAGILGRAFDFGWFFMAALFQALRVKRPDVVVCLTTPPYVSLIGWVLRLLRGAPYVYWAMDLYPDVLVANGMLKRGGVATRLLARLNRFCMKRAAKVVVLGRCMHDRVGAAGIDPSKIVHIGVWSDHEEIGDVPLEANAYRRDWNVGERLLVMYSGNIGIVHDVETMCRAALRLRDDARVAFAFVGQGKRKGEIESFIAKNKLSSVIAPYQPRERLGELLCAADVHLITLKPGFEGIVVPSKLFGVMAAGRAAVFIGPESSEVARVLRECEGGRVIRPGDVDQLVGVIEELAENPERRREMGARARAALETRHDRVHACEAWRLLLEEVAGSKA